MNNGKYVFAQVASFLPARIFDKCVLQYGGNKWVKHFTCWNQLMCMMFGQLSGRESLRDLLITVSAHPINIIIWALERMYPVQIYHWLMSKGIVAFMNLSRMK
jgi:hypothetical protein